MNHKWLMTYPIAHRGLHDQQVPENSMESFKKSMEKNYAIEFDVHMLKDGQLVVFHDDDLLRMTGDNRVLRDVNWEEIKDLKLASGEQGIPLLSDVLNLVAGQVPLVIELKNKGNPKGAMEQAVWRLLESYSGEYSIQSFNPLTLLWFRKRMPQLILGLLIGDLRRENLPFFQRFVLENLFFVPLIRPNYMGVERSWVSKYRFRALRHFFKVPIIGWTFRNVQDYQLVSSDCDNLIFEGFLPTLSE